MGHRTLEFSPTGAAFLRKHSQLQKWRDQPDLPEGPSCEVSLAPDAAEYVWQVTACGVVKCTHASAFRSATRRAGIRSIDLDEADRLAAVFVLSERTRNADVVIVTAGGIANRFSTDDVRPMERLARGVRGIKLAEGNAGEIADEVATAFPIDADHSDCLIGLLTANGHAIRFSASNLPVHGRGDCGVIACRTSTETGPVIFAAPLFADDRAAEQSSPKQWAQVPWATVPVRPLRTGKWLRIEQPAIPRSA